MVRGRPWVLVLVVRGTMAHLSLSLLGPLQITLGDQPISGFAYAKARALLLYLAVEADRPHQREALVTLLWPELPESAARTNLRQALSSLRETLGDATANPPFLLITRDTLQFNRESDYQLDSGVFEALLATCHAHSHRHLHRCRSCLERLAGAATLYRGDFLAEFSLADSQAFEEWELLKREGLHQGGLEALSILAAYHERRGNDEQARHYAQRQIELDPWREEAHRHLMRVLARAGQRSAALAQYESCRRVLAAALGVAPTPATCALYAHIRDGTGPATADAAAPSAVPRLPTPIVDRQGEQRELEALLENAAYRLITIAGPGGIGKTSLALAVADKLADTFEAGAVFVALAGLTLPEQLPGAILQALGVPLHGAAEQHAQVAATLREREMLLLLDNFETLLDARGEAARHVAALLHAAPRVTWLVTSQERLGLQAEWVFELEGLARPPIEATRPGLSEPIEGFAAVRLFVERARQAQRHFALDPQTAPAVVRICQLVEGLPLAIELAAAQVRDQTVDVIAADISANTHAFKTVFHDVPERHHSLWATFEYAWQRLKPEERSTLSRLAIFRGGFSIAAAERVAGGTAAMLTVLATRSIVRSSPLAQAPEEQRFDLHEMTRQFAFKKLHATPAYAATCQSHAEYFTALAETAAPHLTAAEQVTWLNRLEREHANLRAALRWALAAGAAEIAGRLGSALWRFWWLHSHLVEGRGWLSQISALGEAISPAVRATVLNGAGVLANDLGDYAAAQGCHEQALDLRRALNDALGMARSLGNLGNTARQMGDKAQSRSYFAECLSIFRALENQWGIATTLLNLGVIADDGALDEQEALYSESMALYRQLGDRHGMSIAIGNLGELALRRRAFPEARRLYGEYIELSLTVGDTPSVAHSLMMLGIIAMEDRMTRPGVQCFGAAARLRATAGVPVLAAYREEYERYVAAARASLGGQAFDTAWAEGDGMPLEQALRVAC